MLGLVSSARALPFTGTLTLDAMRLGPAFGIEGQGDATVFPDGSVSVPAGAFEGTGTVSIPCCSFRPLVDIAFGSPVANGAGTLAPGRGPGGGFGGSLPFSGFVRFGLFGPPPFAFLTVPLLIGQQGYTSISNPALGIQVSLEGTEWTTGVATVTIETSRGIVTFTSRFTGGDSRTAGGLGRLVLVSPAVLRTNIGGFTETSFAAMLDLEFVPEPGSALLLGLGAALLSARGSRDLRGRRGSPARASP